MPPFVADKNYFELFGLPVTFDVNLTGLTERYRSVARETHPDRFVSGSDQERRLAMQMTAFVNEAFQTLKDPIARARYLLQLRGADPGSDTDTAMDPAFLSEQIELRERLDEACDAADAKARLGHLADDVAQRTQETTDALRIQFMRADQLDKARGLVRELQFLDKLRRQIGDLEERFG